MQTARYDCVVRYDVGDGEHDFGVYGVLVSVVFFRCVGDVVAGERCEPRIPSAEDCLHSAGEVAVADPPACWGRPRNFQFINPTSGVISLTTLSLTVSSRGAK